MLQAGRETSFRVPRHPSRAHIGKGKATSRLSLALDHGYVLVATKHLSAAEDADRQIADQTGRLGLLRLHLEASLALGEVQMQMRNPEMGRKRLEETEKASHSKDFELIAWSASAARQAASR